MLAGINTFGRRYLSKFGLAAPFVPFYGSGGGGTVVSSYDPWIEQQMAPLPLPSTVWLGLVGLGALGAVRGYRRPRLV